MKVAMKLLASHCGVSQCCKPVQCLAYRFASESSQKVEKELLPSEQRFHEVAIELRTKQTFLNVIGEFRDRIVIDVIQDNL